ncbi:MAG: ribosomal protein S18-alanine N-acetyltransferase [Burkholderiales bacterium]|jgi:ribosomal-protein-alanine N-acetyltransferase|nr:ribosomal protein S18-alanine N-acetyltransferase [Burkholderiales bacterium]
MSAVLSEPAERIAPMRPEDLADVLAVERVAYEFPWTDGNFIDSLRAGHSAWTMRDSGGGLIAYAVVMIALDEAHLLNLTVAPACQRFGFGWRMLEAMAENARGYGARTMLLEVRPGNVAAQQMYARYGFVRIGTRRGYYPARDGREDAIVMRVML